MKTIDITDKNCPYNITDLEINDYLIMSVGTFRVIGKNNGKIVCKKVKGEQNGIRKNR